MAEASNYSNKTFVIGVIIFIICALFLYAVRSILAPFILAAFFAYLIYPVINSLHSLGLKRWAAALILVLTIVLAALIAVLVLLPKLIYQGESLISSAPDYYKNILQYVSMFKSKIEVAFPMFERYDFLDRSLDRFADFITQTLSSFPHYLRNL
ncbi:MAG: AI-2E family transporter, partial [Elusimicrobia bacterium]|nr:AI-2E family transporter [Elusimicrobiota bacterium]